MNFIEKLKETLTEKILAGVIGAIVGLVVVVASALAPDVLPILSSPRLQKVVVPILGISLILNLFLGLCIWLLSKTPKFRTRFGFFWDRNLQPHCPACESPMQWGEWSGTNGPGLLCGKCHKARHLADDAGKKISIEEVRSLLKAEK